MWRTNQIETSHGREVYKEYFIVNICFKWGIYKKEEFMKKENLLFWIYTTSMIIILSFNYLFSFCSI